MPINRGKEFEDVVRKCFKQVPDTSITRLHDQTTGYLGSSNICDFIVYRYPFQYFIECKCVHGNTLPLSNITETQFVGLQQVSKIPGVFAGVICWWIDADKTYYLPISFLEIMREKGAKSVSWKNKDIWGIEIKGEKKRVFFDYDMKLFLDTLSDLYGDYHGATRL